jgi:hypothetical protein
VRSELSHVLFPGALIAADGGLTVFADWAEDRHSCSVLCLWVSFGLGDCFLSMKLPSMKFQCRASNAASDSRRSDSISSRDLRGAFGLRL